MKTPSIQIIGVVSLVGILSGCSNPADKVPSATVSTNAPSASADAKPASGAVKRFVISPENSKVEFIGSKVTGSHSGGFKHVKGEIAVEGNQVANSGTKVVIDATSVYSDNERLTGHLKSPDFFDVEKFPSSTFETTSVAAKGTNFTVTGNLTLHGVTKQISFPANIQVTENEVNLDADFSINRFDFAIQYPGKTDDLIRKEVVLKLKVKATPGQGGIKG